MSLKKYLPYNVTFLMTQKSAKRGKFYDQNLLSILTWKKAIVDALDILNSANSKIHIFENSMMKIYLHL